ncbi:MAG: hypothetical protein SFW67_20190 [Myxococcaceae bacterium]|nr:hypothetical protein [Myxococcaceae bacterium]
MGLIKSAIGLVNIANGTGRLVSRFPFVMTGGLIIGLGFWLGAFSWKGLVGGVVAAAVLIGPAYVRALKMARRHQAELKALQDQLNQ